MLYTNEQLGKGFTGKGFTGQAMYGYGSKKRETVMNASEKSMGAEITDRLRRFTEKLDSIEDVADLSEVLTVRKVKRDLRPRSFSSDEVRDIRKLLRVSQPVLAEFLGVSPSTVKDWEQGVCSPQGPACRILEEMQRDLELWSKRIRELATVTAE